ncbi:DUF262 domain-containing protein [Streptomyces niveus]|uniref:DUF262 domain-containing protein n=1 Tax=Streptomyces niveus TaxID=193462 RepID=UPI0036AA61EC
MTLRWFANQSADERAPMSITPRGMSIQEAYSLYRSEKMIVNRNYQRKLVWGVDEKVHLIDSILKGFPIPLFLLAETVDGNFEIIDGMQRLDAIFGFIEHKYAIPRGSKKNSLTCRNSLAHANSRRLGPSKEHPEMST